MKKQNNQNFDIRTRKQMEELKPKTVMTAYSFFKQHVQQILKPSSAKVCQIQYQFADIDEEKRAKDFIIKLIEENDMTNIKGNLKVLCMRRIMGNRWKEMNERQKAPYLNFAKQDKERQKKEDQKMLSSLIKLGKRGRRASRNDSVHNSVRKYLKTKKSRALQIESKKSNQKSISAVKESKFSKKALLQKRISELENENETLDKKIEKLSEQKRRLKKECWKKELFSQILFKKYKKFKIQSEVNNSAKNDQPLQSNNLFEISKDSKDFGNIDDPNDETRSEIEPKQENIFSIQSNEEDINLIKDQFIGDKNQELSNIISKENENHTDFLPVNQSTQFLFQTYQANLMDYFDVLLNQ